MSPSPSIKHQRVSSRLHASFFNYLKGKSCEVFHAPIDIELKKDAVSYERNFVEYFFHLIATSAQGQAHSWATPRRKSFLQGTSS
ncbi:MAG: hypothetical protein ACRDA5_03920 [Clostridium sp.]